ncbi:hypothetical protein D3H35_07615 [Cohnella faecalis]|uniref:Uncharacterized protein n=1 Tax=Cohnella faecalis TaxID=2315694 RepID=A0A398CPD4_9BACL|nr:hypothetical protein D3H35_07615 [Cohnella faecalis]
MNQGSLIAEAFLFDARDKRRTGANSIGQDRQKGNLGVIDRKTVFEKLLPPHPARLREARPCLP